MFKKLIFIFLLLSLIVFPPKVSAKEDFLVDAQVEYKVSEKGITYVTNTITIENATSDLYAASYSIYLTGIEPQDLKVFEDGKEINLIQKKENESFSFTINFENPVVGEGGQKTFKLVYSVASIASKTGEIWEVFIPRISNPESYRSYSVVLSVPTSFGDASYVSPSPIGIEKIDETLSYTFGKGAVSETGINAGFGEFQVFAFSLNYHLENPISREAVTEIALPPDTAFQKLYYEKIEPVPESVKVDTDGNWLAEYKLRPRERLDIQVAGAVQISASPRPFSSPSSSALMSNLEKAEFWEVDEPEIVELATTLKTPQAIYDFVVAKLKYDYERVQPNVTRKGAREALKTPSSAICMEFTDLFIALARATGIPAREINGFAYTENPQIQPLSLVADVLHSWPEYWDTSRNVWVPVDPTWGATSGIDYFEKLDLRHFAFVIHGESSTKPYPAGSYKLGPNPQKDVFVNFGYLPNLRRTQPKVITYTEKKIPGGNPKITISVENPGPTALYRLSAKVYFDGKVVTSDYIEALPPYAEYQLQTSIPFSFLGLKTPYEVKIEVGETTTFVPSFRNQVIIYNLIFLSVILLTVTLLVLVKTGKIKLKKTNLFLARYAENLPKAKKTKTKKEKS